MPARARASSTRAAAAARSWLAASASSTRWSRAGSPNRRPPVVGDRPRAGVLAVAGRHRGLGPAVVGPRARGSRRATGSRRARRSRRCRRSGFMPSSVAGGLRGGRVAVAPRHPAEEERHEGHRDRASRRACRRARRCPSSAARRRRRRSTRASGSTPRMKASEVITIGRKRSRAALVAASIDRSSPASRCCEANSTIRMAFFAARPTSVTSPIWK